MSTGNENDESERNSKILDLFQIADALGSIESPEKEPYKQQYAARTALEKALSYVKGGDQVCIEHSIIRSRVEARLGCIANEVEEPHVAENLLSRALSILIPDSETIENHADNESGTNLKNFEILAAARGDKECAIDVARALHQSALLWDSRDESFRAQRFLEVSLSLCQAESLNDLETEALYFLAQIHGKLGNADKSAHYCRETLERQVKEIHLNEFEWTKNALGISAYYAAKHRYSAAMSCLCAAKIILFSSATNSEEKMKIHADIHLAIGKLLLGLLDEKSNNQQDKDDDALLFAVRQRKLIQTIDTTSLETIFKKSFIEQFRLAKSSFESAAQYYVLDGFVTEHIEIARDLSQLYAVLVNEENETKRQIALQQRRIDLLEPLRTKINAKIFADLRAVLAFEIGDIASNMLDLKAKRVNDPQCNSIKAKNNACIRLRDLALSAYDDFATCCLTSHEKEKENKPDPAFVLDQDEALVFLKSRFYAARVQGRVFADKEPVTLLKLSLKRYTETVEIAKRIIHQRKFFQDSTHSFHQELAICEDMIELLPHKIQHAQNSGSILDETLLPPAPPPSSSSSSSSNTATSYPGGKTPIQFPA
uniref:KIF-binding protein n=1 Tax=Aureoumbra lagunensis TaxID=44058 RepID=A0A7S3JNX2_9STRA